MRRETRQSRATAAAEVTGQSGPALSIQAAAPLTVGGREMIGSEKQIAWATEIQQQAMHRLERVLVDRIGIHSITGQQMDWGVEAREIFGVIREQAASIESAQWWIDHRGVAEHTSLAVSCVGAHAGLTDRGLSGKAFRKLVECVDNQFGG